ncbi:hypothetical protein B0H10DRAFT_1396900 [Mycena sp. CBHHK59/15]|nr:hypothetical protein B0H10DRAFT_1396900 [Mycena sp. CBHHK59/15]
MAIPSPPMTIRGLPPSSNAIPTSSDRHSAGNGMHPPSKKPRLARSSDEDITLPPPSSGGYNFPPPQHFRGGGGNSGAYGAPTPPFFPPQTPRPRSSRACSTRRPSAAARATRPRASTTRGCTSSSCARSSVSRGTPPGRARSPSTGPSTASRRRRRPKVTAAATRTGWTFCHQGQTRVVAEEGEGAGARVGRRGSVVAEAAVGAAWAVVEASARPAHARIRAAAPARAHRGPSRAAGAASGTRTSGTRTGEEEDDGRLKFTHQPDGHFSLLYLLPADATDRVNRDTCILTHFNQFLSCVMHWLAFASYY